MCFTQKTMGWENGTSWTGDAAAPFGLGGSANPTERGMGSRHVFDRAEGMGASGLNDPNATNAAEATETKKTTEDKP